MNGSTEQIRRLRLFVSGRVQGVFFRARTQEQAELLNITGWVRNLHDGRVEILAEGSEDALNKLISWCRQGSRLSSVSGVEIIEEQAEGESSFTFFDIRY